MSQNRIIQLLARELAGEISMEELTELNDLKSKYPNTVYYEELLKQIWTNSPDEQDVSNQLAKHQEKYFNSYSSGKKWNFNTTRNYKRVLQVACVFIFVMVSFLLLNHYEDYFFSRDIEIVAERGTKKNIILPDGTNVWLNSESKLSYDKDIATNSERVITLEGEGFFDVRHDHKRPFIIKTNQISIKVLGTAFNVKAYENDKQTETSLVSGAIELYVNKDPTKKIILNPSEKFIYSEDSLVPSINKKDATTAKPAIERLVPVVIANHEYIKEISWTNNLLIFKNESLEELLPKLERWYNVKINIKNDKVKDYRFTGSFSGETIEEALSAMQLIKHYEFKITGHDIDIY